MSSRSILTPIAVTGAVAAAVTTAVFVKRNARLRLARDREPRDELPEISVSTTEVSTAELEPSSRGADAGRGDTYDAVSPDDLGAEWLARATEAMPIQEPESLDPADLQTLDPDEFAAPEPEAEQTHGTQAVPRAVFDTGDDEPSR